MVGKTWTLKETLADVLQIKLYILTWSYFVALFLGIFANRVQEFGTLKTNSSHGNFSIQIVESKGNTIRILVLSYLIAKLYLFCGPMDSSPLGSVHGIFQERILECVAISFSRESSRPRDRTHISCIGRQILDCRVTWEAPKLEYLASINKHANHL